MYRLQAMAAIPPAFSTNLQLAVPWILGQPSRDEVVPKPRIGPKKFFKDLSAQPQKMPTKKKKAHP